MKKPSKQPSKQKSGGKKKKYRVRNWKEYNEALVRRGEVTFWIAQEAVEKWKSEEKTSKPGRPKAFSDTAIETALTLREVFHLSLRQTEGFLRSVLKAMRAVANAPDYSTLSLRAAALDVTIRVRPVSGKPLHIVVDSTGVKVYGEGEWKVRQHGWSKRRTWTKVHLGVDEASGDVVAGEVTSNSVADGEMLGPLLAQLPDAVVIDQCSADGAYDKRRCYAALQKRNVRQIAIPPRHGARIWRHGNSMEERLPRDENVRAIRMVGRKRWKKNVNYHRRSLSETTMFRYKTIFGEDVSNRTDQNQRTQLLLRIRALNLMTTLGMPRSEAVA